MNLVGGQVSAYKLSFTEAYGVLHGLTRVGRCQSFSSKAEFSVFGRLHPSHLNVMPRK